MALAASAGDGEGGVCMLLDDEWQCGDELGDPLLGFEAADIEEARQPCGMRGGPGVCGCWGDAIWYHGDVFEADAVGGVGDELAGGDVGFDMILEPEVLSGAGVFKPIA